jgi:hypothetical protein
LIAQWERCVELIRLSVFRAKVYGDDECNQREIRQKDVQRQPCSSFCHQSGHWRLIRVKTSAGVETMLAARIGGAVTMPLDAASIFILSSIVLAFVLFGEALMWGDFQTHRTKK